MSASKPHSDPLTTIKDCVRLQTVMGPPKFFAALQSLEEQLEASEEYAKEGWAWLGAALHALGVSLMPDSPHSSAEALRGNVEAGLRLLLKSEKPIYRRVAEIGMEDLQRLFEQLEVALATLEYMGNAEIVVDAIRNGELPEPGGRQ